MHFFGASLGGLLAQQYAMARPSRVSSIILCNSFFSTTSYIPTAGSMVTSMYAVTPYFVLKNMLLTSFNNDAAAISASVSGTLTSRLALLSPIHARATCAPTHTCVCKYTRTRKHAQQPSRADMREHVQPEVAEAVEFAIEQVGTLSQEDLASRLTLNCSPCECSGLKLSQVCPVRGGRRQSGTLTDR